jgi:hypothetical protein
MEECSLDQEDMIFETEHTRSKGDRSRAEHKDTMTISTEMPLRLLKDDKIETIIVEELEE